MDGRDFLSTFQWTSQLKGACGSVCVQNPNSTLGRIMDVQIWFDLLLSEKRYGEGGEEALTHKVGKNRTRICFQR